MNIIEFLIWVFTLILAGLVGFALHLVIKGKEIAEKDYKINMLEVNYHVRGEVIKELKGENEKLEQYIKKYCAENFMPKGEDKNGR